MELLCTVQDYEWGKRGDRGIVGLIAAANHTTFIIDVAPYAEFWMGVHPNGPSRVKKTNKPLSEYLKEHPVELGEDILNTYGPTLPFLFKVLSVDKALSIQAHPAKEHAEQLHLMFPAIYKDPNHKPELAIAVTEFETLCGFRPRHEIENCLKAVPEFAQFLGNDLVSSFLAGNDGIRVCFEALMKMPTQSVRNFITTVSRRKEPANEMTLLRKLNSQYPGDVGVLCVFWMNHLILSPGEALFLAPNEPHAYISGNCVECMANSDNVVRAGLTPKLRDVPTLCDMLTYKSYDPAELKLQPVKEDEHTLLYKPPVKEFAVAKINVEKDKAYTLLERKNASIVICTSGRGTAQSCLGEIEDFKYGRVIFLPAGGLLTVKGTEDLVLFQATYNV